MKAYLERLGNSSIAKNPIFITALGPYPIFVVTTSAVNAVDMGLSSLVVLMFSNLTISALSSVTPRRVRPPVETVVTASLVTIVQPLIQGFMLSIYTILGIYIPLTVVNYITLGRTEAYALGAESIPALFDGLGTGLGFALALLLFDFFREIIGVGSTFSVKLTLDVYHISVLVLPPDVFFVMTFPVVSIQHYQDDKRGKKSRPISLEEAETKVMKLITKPAAAAAATQTTAATTTVEIENPATEKKEEVK